MAFSMVFGDTRQKSMRFKLCSKEDTMRKIFWFCIFVICGQPVLSGPDETINYLMNDTASMMDIGMLRLSFALQRDAIGFANYNWDENRIKISAPYLNANGAYDTAEAAEKACSKWVTELRRVFGVNPATGKPFWGESSRAADYFRHRGFNKMNAPETLYEDIDKLIIFECYANSAESLVKVTGALVAKGYSVAKD
jgi:hypothetical protein